MRWWILLCLGLLCLSSPAWAVLSGRGTVTYSTGKSFEDGRETSSFSRLNQNYFLDLTRPVTPYVSYRAGLRVNVSDRSLSAEGVTRDRSLRTFTPSLDVMVRNPFYDLTTGYRRQEEFNGKELENDTRLTTQFYYGRLQLHVGNFPPVLLEYSRRETFDHLPVRRTDSTGTRYAASTNDTFRAGDLRASYNLNYDRSETETPLTQVSETIRNQYGGAYTISYRRAFWEGRANVRANYRGTYSRSVTQTFISGTGDVLLGRAPLVGLYALGVETELFGNAPVLSTTAVTGLIDAGLDSTSPRLAEPVSPEISLLGEPENRFHNIGIEIQDATQTVDRIFVYVQVEGTMPDDGASLTIPWEAFVSPTNNDDWQHIASHLDSVSPVSVPGFENIFRYEIVFDSPQTGPFFKVINQQAVDAVTVPLVTDVRVTEIEAYGIEAVPTTGKLSSEEEVIIQGFRVSASVAPFRKWSFDVNASVDRSDAQPENIAGSMGGTFANLFVKDIGGGGKQVSSVRRSYGSGVNWRALEKYLTASLRAQRSEFFDNLGLVDNSTNTYSLALSSAPLPTVDIHFNAARSERFDFSQKKSTSHSFVLSVGTKLYRGVNMLTDAVYSMSKDEETGDESTSTTLNGNIDARFTEQLFSTLRYSVSHSESETASTTSVQSTLAASYRPARFLNFSGAFNFQDTESSTRTSEAVSANWLPAPVFRLNASYAHSDTNPGATSDTVSSSGRWEITDFLSLRLTYSYSRSKREKTTESHVFTGTLSGRVCAR
ncbi:MAG: hypothetical protein P8Y66_05120 [Nitrospirota bacterium]